MSEAGTESQIKALNRNSAIVHILHQQPHASVSYALVAMVLRERPRIYNKLAVERTFSGYMSVLLNRVHSIMVLLCSKNFIVERPDELAISFGLNRCDKPGLEAVIIIINWMASERRNFLTPVTQRQVADFAKTVQALADKAPESLTEEEMHDAASLHYLSMLPEEELVDLLPAEIFDSLFEVGRIGFTRNSEAEEE